MFNNAWVKVSGCHSNIICILQITFKYVNNAILVYQVSFLLFLLTILFKLTSSKYRLNSDIIDLSLPNSTGGFLVFERNVDTHNLVSCGTILASF